MLIPFLAACRHNMLTDFENFPIKIVDAETSQPVGHAVITTMCLGGTPYETNTYVTDDNGSAHVWSYRGGILGIDVKKNGYESANIVVSRTNAVVHMRRANLPNPLTKSEVIEAARHEAEERRIPLSEFQGPIVQRSAGSSHAWLVFWHRDRYPGDHFLIQVDELSGEARFWGGK